MGTILENWNVLLHRKDKKCYFFQNTFLEKLPHSAFWHLDIFFSGSSEAKTFFLPSNWKNKSKLFSSIHSIAKLKLDMGDVQVGGWTRYFDPLFVSASAYGRKLANLVLNYSLWKSIFKYFKTFKFSVVKASVWNCLGTSCYQTRTLGSVFM